STAIRLQLTAAKVRCPIVLRKNKMERRIERPQSFHAGEIPIRIVGRFNHDAIALLIGLAV
ncbi:MAG TPA: hypothetical protein VIW48_01065, partial [Nitrospiraceae bacterium]